MGRWSHGQASIDPTALGHGGGIGHNEMPQQSVGLFIGQFGGTYLAWVQLRASDTQTPAGYSCTQASTDLHELD